MPERERAHVIDILPYTVIFFVGKQYHKGRLVVVAKRYAMVSACPFFMCMLPSTLG